jgi:hypothetical protein
MIALDPFTTPGDTAARKPDPTLLERLDLTGPDHGVSDITIIASVIAAARAAA